MLRRPRVSTRTDNLLPNTELFRSLADGGGLAGDGIEHDGMAPPELVATRAELVVLVVTQPNFIAERGDAYLRDVAASDQPWLYRLRGLQAAGVALAGRSDAPFGRADPWLAMQAAVRSEEPTSELQSLMLISSAVFCLKKKTIQLTLSYDLLS